jgi:hypothetical protein
MQQAKPRIILLNSVLLPDYPSGSAISYYDGKFYLVGDDARNIAVLDRDYREAGTIPLFEHPEKRIPKTEKTDFETAVITDIQQQPHLLAIGSASRKEREQVMLLPLRQPSGHFSRFDTAVFTARLRGSGIKEVNIEGATLAGELLILANRGNNTYPENHLLITGKDYWFHQDEAPLSVLPLTLPPGMNSFLGVSELCYDPLSDTLLFTLSSEATANAYDDGAIGDSYIAWVNHFSQKIKQTGLSLDALINLPEANAAFKGEKIEGICIEAAHHNEWLLHLVADNDKGQSRLFRLKLLRDPQ